MFVSLSFSITVAVLEVAVADAEGDVLQVKAADIFAIFFGWEPMGFLHEPDGLIVAAAAHRVDNDDV